MYWAWCVAIFKNYKFPRLWACGGPVGLGGLVDCCIKDMYEQYTKLIGIPPLTQASFSFCLWPFLHGIDPVSKSVVYHCHFGCVVWYMTIVWCHVGYGTRHFYDPPKSLNTVTEVYYTATGRVLSLVRLKCTHWVPKSDLIRFEDCCIDVVKYVSVIFFQNYDNLCALGCGTRHFYDPPKSLNTVTVTWNENKHSKDTPGLTHPTGMW